MNPPLISVLMPVFNASDYLSEAIESVLKQTYTNFEFIIINDGSTDNSKEIILSYKDNRIKFFDNKLNAGLIESLNAGLNKVTGKYIARMDSDDISCLDRFQIQVDFLEKNPQIGVCGTFIEYFGDYKGKWKPPTNHDGIVAGLINGSTMCHPSVMIRSCILRKNNIFFDPNYKFAEDYHLWYVLSNLTTMVNIPQFLLKYRINNHQVSQIFSKEQQLVKNQIRYFCLERIRPLTKIEQVLFFDLPKNSHDLDSCIQILQNLIELNNAKRVFKPFYLRQELSMVMLSKLTQTHFGFVGLYKVIKAGLGYGWTIRMRMGLLKKIILKPISA